MTRRRSTRSTRSRRQTDRVRLRGGERVLFILGATLYVIGLFGGTGLLPMAAISTTLLLAVGGGLHFAVILLLIL